MKLTGYILWFLISKFHECFHAQLNAVHAAGNLRQTFGLYQENDIPEEITEATKSIQFVVKTTGLELLIVYKVEFLWAKA